MEKQKSVRIRLNRLFYRKEAVEQAINDFGNVCRGRFINEEIVLELKLKQNIDNLKEEFCNYVLGIMKNNSLV